jgi:hypothetical protein
MKPFSLVMKCLLTASIFLLIPGCNPSVEKTDPTKILIDSISELYIPDQRTGICNIRVRTGVDEALILAGETTDPDLKTSLINTLSNQGNEVIDSILLLPDTLLNRKYTGLVTLSVINIRKHPSHSAEMVSQAVLGTPVRILKNVGSWFLIQTPDHYIGYTESSSLEPMTREEMAEWKRSDRVMTVVNSGSVYSATDESGITGDFVAGCIFIRVGEDQSHTIVRFPDGRQGYIHSRSVRDFSKWKADAAFTEAGLQKCASAFTGLPYLWGGTSSKGFDCSGFSQTVYYLNGTILMRDASQQALHGLNVDISAGYGKLKPGDLLFFGTREMAELHVTHVAVYKGDSEYFHSSGMVRINSLDSTRGNYNSFRENSLLSAKRIIGADNGPGIVRIRSHPWY